MISDQQLTQLIQDKYQEYNDPTNLGKIQLDKLMERINPFTMAMKPDISPETLLHDFLLPKVSSSEETRIGEFLEKCALGVLLLARKPAMKSGIPGIDIEVNESVRYIIANKSGPNWGNSDQWTALLKNFAKAKSTLRTNGALQATAIVGMCYGRANTSLTGKADEECIKMIGEEYWKFLSNEPDMYHRILSVLASVSRQIPNLYQCLQFQTLKKSLLAQIEDRYYDGGKFRFERLGVKMTKVDTSSLVPQSKWGPMDLFAQGKEEEF